MRQVNPGLGGEREDAVAERTRLLEEERCRVSGQTTQVGSPHRSLAGELGVTRDRLLLVGRIPLVVLLDVAPARSRPAASPPACAGRSGPRASGPERHARDQHGEHDEGRRETGARRPAGSRTSAAITALKNTSSAEIP